jgi:hypothetical protein
MNKYKAFMIFFFIILLMILNFGFPQALGDESEAITSISHVKESAIGVYISVLEIERKGGDVSVLIERLNNILNNLAEAELAFEAGNYDLATQIANSEIEVLILLSEEVMDLKKETEVQKELEFRNKLLLSAGSICVILFCGYFGWRRFKEYYLQGLMDSRLEVLSDEP